MWLPLTMRVEKNWQGSRSRQAGRGDQPTQATSCVSGTCWGPVPIYCLHLKMDRLEFMLPGS